MGGVERMRRDLRQELLAAAVAGARARGRQGVVLREAARVVGVSPTAAYRHFDGYDDLLGAVCQVAGERLYASMLGEIERAAGLALDAAARAHAHLRGTGRGYVLFAVHEHGLFECLAAAPPPPPDVHPRALELLTETLDECLQARILAPEARPGAEALAWIAVHGLAMQALQGIVPAEGPDFDALLERTLDFVDRGLGISG